MVQRALNAAGMKLRNRRKIIEHLRITPISRAELSRKTGLTRAGISVIVDELLAEGVLLEGNAITGKVGRTSVELMLNPEYGFAVGVDLARDYCSVGIGDFNGGIREVYEIDGHGDTAAETMRKLFQKIDRLLESNDCGVRFSDKPGGFLGIGITAPGPLDVENGRMLNPPNFEKWQQIDIAAYFTEKYHCPVYLENNAKALALAEKYYGIGSRYQNYVELIVDTGVGGGIVLDGKLYQGSSYLAGDFGHMCIDVNGNRCGCGNYGCAEMYVAIPNIERYAEETTGEKVSWHQIIDRAAEGDEKMQRIVDREARYLAAVVTNATNIIDTQAVIVASDINYRSEYFLPMIQSYVNSQFIGRGLKEIEIVASDLAENIRILSGVNLVFENGV